MEELCFVVEKMVTLMLQCETRREARLKGEHLILNTPEAYRQTMHKRLYEILINFEQIKEEHI